MFEALERAFNSLSGGNQNSGSASAPVPSPAPNQQGVNSGGSQTTQSTPSEGSGAFNKTEPPAPQDVEKQKNSPSPADKIGALYDTKPTGEPVDLTKPFFDLNPQQFSQQLQTFDFTQGLQPEKVQAAMSGDTAAFMEVMNSVARSAVSASADLTSKVANHTAQTAVSVTRNQLLPAQLNLHSAQVSLGEEQFSQNPVAASITRDLTTRYQQQYPTATAEEIVTFVRGAMTELATSLNSNKGTNQNPQTSQYQAPTKQVDWTSYFQSGKI